MLEVAIHALAEYGHDAVLFTLIGLSLLIVAIGIERLIYQHTQRTKSVLLLRLKPEMVPLEPADTSRLEAAEGLEGRLVSEGLRAGAAAGLTAASEAMDAVMIREEEALERGLSIVGSVGSNAPFIGLLGTVLGIVRAFQDLALDTSGDATAVMSGISEALIATAVGLLVAIPAVVLYNLLARRNERRIRRMHELARIVLFQLQSDDIGARSIAVRKGA